VRRNLGSSIRTRAVPALPAASAAAAAASAAAAAAAAAAAPTERPLCHGGHSRTSGYCRQDRKRRLEPRQRTAVSGPRCCALRV